MDPKPPNATAQLPGRPWTCGASWPSSVFRSRIGVGSPLWHDLRIAHSVVLPRPFSACTRFSFRSSVSPTFAWFRNVPTLLIAMIFLSTTTPFMRIASWSKPHAGLEFSSAMLAGLKSGTRRNGSARRTHSAHFFWQRPPRWLAGRHVSGPGHRRDRPHHWGGSLKRSMTHVSPGQSRISSITRPRVSGKGRPWLS